MGKNKKEFKKKCETCGNSFNPGRHKEKKNCSPECLAIYKEKNKEDRLRKSREGLLKKHGVDHPSKIPGHALKVKKTKFENYGDENYNNREKAKKTVFEEHGVDNTMKIDSVKKKSKKTKKERYNDDTYNNREKAKKTIKENYGVEHHLQTEESLKKMRDTNKKLYGIEYTVNTEKCNKNLKKVNNEIYGVDYFFSSEIHSKRQYKYKIENLKKILEISNIEFDLNTYKEIRTIKIGGGYEHTYYKVKCKKCGNIFETTLKNEPIVCRKCYPVNTSSKIQREFRDFLDDIDIPFFENNRKLIKPLEVDFYIPDFNITFEINGNYWHSELHGLKNRKYHINKTELCNNKNIKLIHIFEDEWLFKKEIVKSRIKNILNLCNKKIYARKCKIKKIDSKIKTSFLLENHLQGNSVDNIRLGLFYNDEIVSVMTFSKRRMALGARESKDGEYELVRFCSKINTNVIGGFQKLLSYFVKNYNSKKIITYADCRWSGINHEETVYFKRNFKFIHRTPPSFFYIHKKDFLIRKHRFSLNKNKLLKLYSADSKKTGWQIAQDNGYDRIWDCGTLKFELEL